MQFMKSAPPISKLEASIKVKIYQYATDPESTWHIDIREEAQFGAHKYCKEHQQVLANANDIKMLPKVNISLDLIQMILPHSNKPGTLFFQLNDDALKECTFPMSVKGFGFFIAICEKKIQDTLSELVAKKYDYLYWDSQKVKIGL